MVNYDLFDGILFFDIKQLLMNNVKKKWNGYQVYV